MIASEMMIMPIDCGVMRNSPISISSEGNMLGNSCGLVPQMTMDALRST